MHLVVDTAELRVGLVGGWVVPSWRLCAFIIGSLRLQAIIIALAEVQRPCPSVFCSLLRFPLQRRLVFVLQRMAFGGSSRPTWYIMLLWRFALLASFIEE